MTASPPSAASGAQAAVVTAIPPPAPRPVVVAGTSDRAIAAILLLLLMATLYVAKALFLPLIVAVLLSFLFAPAVRWLADIGLPRVVAAMLVLAATGGVVGAGVYGLAAPASAWMERLPNALTQVERKLRTFKHPVDRVNDAATQVETMTGPRDSGHPQVTMSAPSTFRAQLMTGTGQVVAGTIFAAIALFLLLATGGTILERIVALIPALRTDNDASNLLLGTPQLDSTMVLRESERLVGIFLRTTLIINGCLTVVLSASFWAVGLPDPILWGVIAGTLNFLPYVGPLIGIPLIALASLVSFDTISGAVVPPLIYIACAAIEGNMATPYILGRRLEMSPIAIFLWMALWAWMWGTAGALIAVPMLVMVKEFCSRIDRLNGFARLVEP